MRDSWQTPARSYFPGIGDAVADRTVNRKIEAALPEMEVVKITLPRRDDMALDHEVDEYCKSGGYIIDGYHVTYGDDVIVEIDLHVIARRRREIWAEVAQRVATGNALLDPRGFIEQMKQFHGMNHHLRQASILMSGRHLQHGDETQPSRNQEVFTNCSTAASAFLSYYLLLNGSGVGRAYDDAMMIVDWAQMPVVIPVIDMSHADVQSGEIQALDQRNAAHLYQGAEIVVFEVPDSREGWAKAIEQIELMAYRQEREKVLLLDFSKVRCKGSPIRGMQNRPASGPGPMIDAVRNIARVRDAGMEPWRAAMYVDHYLAECVLVGGARRAARMATKTWRDANVFGFIEVKRGGFLWSSNNSVTVDEDFWRYVKMGVEELTQLDDEEHRLAAHAKTVLDAVAEASYFDQTGEPGLINQAKLTENNEGLEAFKDGLFADSSRYQLDDAALPLMQALAKATLESPYKMITNPCGEIALLMLGGYCVIADVVPYHAAMEMREQQGNGNDATLHPSELIEWDADAEDAFRTATRALIRTNTMDCLYGREVKRTNRIGVGITGLHEYAWARFGYGFRDIIDEAKAQDFWLMLSRFSRAVKDEAARYSRELGVVVPHTNTTIKPAGTTSKLFGLTEGAHLASMREYLRWVQFRNDDPLVEEYRAKGYPIRKLKSYSGTTIVGFPTQPEICRLGMGDKLVTAAEATPEEQYQYLRLMEKYWIRGVDENGELLPESGNQVSFTLKYFPETVSYERFRQTLIDGQSTIRCCSVMPQTDTTAYEYQPEEPVTKHQYELITQALKAANGVKEEVAFEHVDCASGACPVDFEGKE